MACVTLGVLGCGNGLRVLHGLNRTSARHVRVSSDNLKQDKIIEGADISTRAGYPVENRGEYDYYYMDVYTEKTNIRFLDISYHIRIEWDILY